MRHTVSLLCGLLLAVAGGAMAQDAPAQNRVVVELYTAQGCSSCPPADALMAELVKDPRVIALALHVDYWDYLGWKDGFAQGQFTKRQKSYAKVSGERMIYTPQMIVGGVDRVIGSKPDEVAAAVERQAAVATTVRVSIRREGDRIMIHAESVPPSDRPLRIDLVRYHPQEEVAIERGENAGKTVTYYNIVTAWEPLANWNAAEPIEVEAAAGDGGPAVVVIQSEGPREIVAAAAVQ